MDASGIIRLTFEAFACRSQGITGFISQQTGKCRVHVLDEPLYANANELTSVVPATSIENGWIMRAVDRKSLKE